MSKFNGLNKGDVVRIKFKPINEITKEMKMTTAIFHLDEYDIGCNVNAMVIGGDFIVIDVVETTNQTTNIKEKHIRVDNHLDGGTFGVYEGMIESAEHVEVTNKFVSEDHGIIMIQVDNKIYVNGELLSDGEESWSDEDKGKLTQLIQFFEKFLVDKAFEGEIGDA